MRMRDIFEIEEVDGKIYMVCLDSDVLAGMIELNETAAYGYSDYLGWNGKNLQ